MQHELSLIGMQIASECCYLETFCPCKRRLEGLILNVGDIFLIYRIRSPYVNIFVYFNKIISKVRIDIGDSCKCMNPDNL